MKKYVQKREPIRAAQWQGEKTPELVELLRGHGHFSRSYPQGLYELRLGTPDQVVPPVPLGSWICSSSGEDFTVLSDDQFHDRYEEVVAVSPPTKASHEEAARGFLTRVDTVLIEGLKLAPDAYTKVFHDRTRLVNELQELFAHQTWLAQREVQDLRNRVRKELDRQDPSQEG